MKKFQILNLATLLLILVSSCSSSDDSDETSSNELMTEILGKWENYQRIQDNQTFDFDQCNRDTFNFFDDLTGSYSVNTGALINGSCVGGSGGYGFKYEASSNGTVKLIALGIDAYILHKDNDQIYVNPIDNGETVNTNIKLLLRKIEN